MIVWGFDYKHGGLEVFAQIGSVEAVIGLGEIFQALWDGETPATTIIEDELEQTLSLDGLHLREGRVELRDEQSAIRQGVYLRLLRILQEVIRVEVSRYPPCRDTRDDYCLSVVEIELLVEVSELLHDVIIPPEVKLLVLVGDGRGTRSRVLTTVTVDDVDFGPIIKDRVFQLLGG